VETVTYKNLNFNVWDLGGQTNIRPYWRCYYANTNAIIYVVDSTDKERLALSRKVKKERRRKRKKKRERKEKAE